MEKKFHIKHNDHELILETEDTRFECLSDLCLCIGDYLLSKGRFDEVRSIISVLEGRVKCTEDL